MVLAVDEQGGAAGSTWHPWQCSRLGFGLGLGLGGLGSGSGLGLRLGLGRPAPALDSSG